VRVFWDLKDPAAMIQQALAPFINQVGKFSPGTVERFQFALDNLSASVGFIFQPLIEGGRELADEFNVLITSVGPELRRAFSQFIEPMKGFAREVFSRLVDAFTDISTALGPVITKVIELGPAIGVLIGGFGKLAGVFIEILTPVFGELVDQTKELIATFMAFGALMEDVAWAIANPAKAGKELASGEWTPVENFKHDFERAMERLNGVFSRPFTGPQTIAAQPARMVGIEELGQQARIAAFSQGSTIEERNEANTKRVADGVDVIAKLLDDAGPIARQLAEVFPILRAFQIVANQVM